MSKSSSGELCCHRLLGLCSSAPITSTGSIIIAMMVMMLPAAMPAIIVLSVVRVVSIAVIIAIIGRGWRIDYGRRRLIYDCRLLDIQRRRRTEVDPDIHVSKGFAWSPRAAENRGGQKDAALDDVLAHCELRSVPAKRCRYRDGVPRMRTSS